MKKRNTAQKIGMTLAYLQHTVDRALNFGFQKLKSTGTKKKSKNDGPVTESIRKTASFLGEVGTEFYESYESLKEKRKAAPKKRPAKKKSPRKRSTRSTKKD